MRKTMNKRLIYSGVRCVYMYAPEETGSEFTLNLFAEAIFGDALWMKCLLRFG